MLNGEWLGPVPFGAARGPDGRLAIDEELMGEIQEVKEALQPYATIFVADSMTGQDAVNVAQAFHAKTPLSGVVLTKLDGDARGGAALSMRQVTGCPVKFAGVGEKLSEFEPFHPERMAGRILDRGDVVSLVEKAAAAIEEDEAKRVGGGAGLVVHPHKHELVRREHRLELGVLGDRLGWVAFQQPADRCEQVPLRGSAGDEEGVPGVAGVVAARPPVVAFGRLVLAELAPLPEVRPREQVHRGHRVPLFDGDPLPAVHVGDE